MRLKSAASLFVVSAALTGAVATAPAASAVSGAPHAPSAAAADLVTVPATDIDVHKKPSLDSEVVGTVDAASYRPICQRVGETVTTGPNKNNWWIWLTDGEHYGYISAVYVSDADMGPVPGIPKC